jgi:hypothetical protein
MLKAEEIEIQIGRAVGGDYIRVTHLPTGISRGKGPPLGNPEKARRGLLRELEVELLQRGLTQYFHPGRPDNLYEQLIRERLEADKRGRPRIRVRQQTLDLTRQGSYNEYWVHADIDLPEGLLARLVEESQHPVDLRSRFVLSPLADQARSRALELFGEHYSPLPYRHKSEIEFSFSTIVASGAISLFYASFDRGFLAAAGMLCVASAGKSPLEIRRLWCS